MDNFMKFSHAINSEIAWLSRRFNNSFVYKLVWSSIDD